MYVIDESLLAKACEGHVDALCCLDESGFLIGSDESLDAYVERLRGFKARFAAMEASLNASGTFEIEGMIFRADERIPPELLAEVREETGKAYHFSIDWVPGFFVDPSFGWLFGGCAYYFYPDFFALFIIRRNFAKADKWLFYSRRELLAHELCHVARIALHSHLFEEEFAYRISGSGFRRHIGGVFRGAADSYMLLGTTFLLLLAQMLKTFFLPRFWIWPFWFLVAAMAMFLTSRYVRTRRILKQAEKKLAKVAGDAVAAVLFRCTDEEIVAIAGFANAAEQQRWVAEKCAVSPRWKVIQKRFLSMPSPAGEMGGTSA